MKSMLVTLSDDDTRNLFHIYNNGITMVVSNSKDLDDDNISLGNIRIVNGCQTSHIIMDMCAEEDGLEKYGQCKVMVRITESNDEELVRSITYATNNQSEVKTVNLLSNKTEITTLAVFFQNRQNGALELLLRRQGKKSIKPTNSLDILELAKAYRSVWLGEPHQAVHHEATTLDKLEESFNDPLFNEKSYLCSYLIKNTNINQSKHISNGRYQLLMVITALMLNLNSLDKLKNYNQPINVNNIDEKLLSTAFETARTAFHQYIKTLKRVDSRHFRKAHVASAIWNLVQR